MTSSTDLRRVLTELTERFVDEVLAAIERAPLSEVAATLPRTRRNTRYTIARMLACRASPVRAPRAPSASR